MHSNQISVVLVDDEENIRAMLRRKIKAYNPMFQIVGETETAQAAIEMVEDLKPELVFLDMELAGSTGLEFLQNSFQYRGFKTVVVTSFGKDYALKTHNCKEKPFYFLQKPIETELLEDMVLKPIANDFRIDGRFAPSDILYIFFNSTIRSASFALTNGQKPVAKKDTLASYKSILDNFSFFQIHESHWINMEHVTAIRTQNDKGEMQRGGYALMSNGDYLKISNHRRPKFNETWAVFQKIK